MPAAAPMITDPPIAPAMLSRLVLSWRRDAPSAGVGAHQRRKQGHSLEFRDYRAWQRGDDIRKVDWRASLRQPRQGELLVRNFEAEEKLSLAILLDVHPGLRLPSAMPRLLYALWAARALAHLALSKGDEVILARLRQGPAEEVLTLAGATAAPRARAWTEALWQSQDALSDDYANLERIAGKLRPAGAVVLISDFLGADPDGRLTRFSHLARRRRRSLSVLQLDSTAHETALLRQAQKFHLIRPGVSGGQDIELFDEAAMAQAARAVSDHIAALKKAMGPGGLDWPDLPVVWPLPAPADAGTATGGLDPERMKQFFSQTFPRLPLLQGLDLGSPR